MKIRYQIFFLFVIFILLMCGAGIYAIHHSETALEQAINQETLAKASVSMKQIDKNIYERIEIFKEYTRDLIFQDALQAFNHRHRNCDNRNGTRHPGDLHTSNRLQEEIGEKLAYYERRYGYPLFLEVDILDHCGHAVACLGQKGQKEPQTCRGETSVAQRGERSFFRHYRDESGMGVIEIAFAAETEEHETIGTVFLSFTLKSIVHELQEQFKNEKIQTSHYDTEFYLADEEGAVIYSSSAGVIGQNIGWMFANVGLMKAEATDAHRDALTYNQYIHAPSEGYRDFEGTGWTFVVKHSLEEIYRPISVLGKTLYLSLALMILLGAVTLFLASTLLSRPLTKLTEASRLIAKGEFRPVDVKVFGELKELVNTFNTMASELKCTRSRLIEEMHRSENARLELRESEEQLAAVTNSAQDAILLIDPSQRIVFSNPSASGMFGYDRRELRGHNILELFEPKSLEGYYVPGLEIFAKSDEGPIMSKMLELTALNKDKELFPVELAISSVLYKERWHLIVMIRDISERKQSDAAIRRREELIISQSRQAAMGEMLSMIAHQWRQPLTTIGLIAGKMRMFHAMSEFSAEEIESAMDKITNQVQYLSHTIDDFRDFLKPDKRLESIRTDEVIRHSMAIIGKSLENNGIRTELILEAKSELRTYANEVVQVLLNLLNNAKDVLMERQVKDPKITLTSQEEGKELMITVCDNGGGVAEDIVERIFEPYFTTKETNGTGLGLYMTRMIVEKNLKGRVAYIKAKTGACFEVRIPRHLEAAAD